MLHNEVQSTDYKNNPYNHCGLLLSIIIGHYVK